MIIKDKSGELFVSADNGITFQPLQSITEIEEIDIIPIPTYDEITKKLEEMYASVDNFKYSRNKKKHLRFLINKEKRTVFLQYYDTKVSIKCREEDEFDWKIGLGLALSKANAINHKKAQVHRNIWFRDKETHKLKVKEYANWVLNVFYNNDMEDLHLLEERVNKAQDKEFITL